MTKPILEVAKKNWDISVEKRLNELTGFRQKLEDGGTIIYNTINYNTYNTYLRGVPGETPTWVALISAIEFIIDGLGSTITTGYKGHLEIPFDCTITRATMLANPDYPGSIAVNIWKSSYANAAPTNANSITASAPPTINSDIKSQDNTLSGWTTNITAGDILAYNVDSVNTIQGVTLSLTVRR